jgi:hypothetical protein
MAYLKFIKTSINKTEPNVDIEKIKDLIDNKIRIHTRDIHYAIRHCDEKIISLMLDNIPTDEYYPCFYGAVVRGNRSTDIIDLLLDKKVPTDDNILIFCIVENKINYIDYFVKKNPYLITSFVLIEAISNRDLILYFVEKIKQHGIYINDYELVMKELCQLYLSGGINDDDYELLEKLQKYNELEVLFYDETKEINMHQKRGFDIIKQNTQVKTRHIDMAVETNSVNFLTDILPKYDHKISNKILSKCKNKKMCDLIEKHNEKYTK